MTEAVNDFPKRLHNLYVNTQGNKWESPACVATPGRAEDPSHDPKFHACIVPTDTQENLLWLQVFKTHLYVLVKLPISDVLAGKSFC